jgi:hypothetical protein
MVVRDPPPSPALSLHDVMQARPGSARVLRRFGVEARSGTETLGEVALRHGVDLGELLRALRDVKTFGPPGST